MIDISAEAGVAVRFFNDEVPGRFFLPEVMGGGVGWIDFDGDGLLDLYVMNGCRLVGSPLPGDRHEPHLFRNLGGGHFADVSSSAQAIHFGYGQGCAIGDFDSDGFPDVYLACWGSDGLLHNNGDGTFSDVTVSSGIDNSLWASSAVWFDADGDHDLDLYVVNYMDVRVDNRRVCEFSGKPGYCGPGEYDAVPDRLFENRGDGTFADMLDEWGFTAENGKGLAVAILDLDDDLLPEVYVGNDMAPNYLFTRSHVTGRPETDKLYAEIATNSGCAVADNGQNEASMGIACADYDNDGRTDIYLSHFFGQKNTLYRNLGGLMFVDDSRRTRVAATSFEFNGFGSVAFDFDRDGWMDIFVTNGHVLGPQQQPHAMRAQLLRNDRAGRFHDISSSAGPYFQDLLLGRSAASADFDNDGDLDLAVSHLHRPLALLRNDTVTQRHFLGLRLTTPDRIPPIGGRVVVTASGHRQVLHLVAGSSYLATHDDRLLVGLGEHGDPAAVTIHWPSGRVDEFVLEPDQYWHVREGFAPETRGSSD
ncbi:MAG: CRTAC1 family protein [Planctomycetales bacterium]|nr:CRTAC1 family protein [Planctomycetales bacterium]